VEQYADLAFSAQSMPVFGYGCAVFMQSDIVNFQRQGWRAEEILAGLATVLPKNVFLYVASIPSGSIKIRVETIDYFFAATAKRSYESARLGKKSKLNWLH
jgi:hypothetical protein